MALRDVLALFEVQVEGISKLKEVEGKLNKLNATLRTVGTAFKAFAGVVAVEKLAEFMHGVLESASAIKDQSQKLGISTDALQKYQELASETGVPVEAMSKALGRFNMQIGETELGGGKANNVFAQLGIHIRNAQGIVKPTTDILGEFADALKLKDVPTQTALAMRAMGKSGAALIPLLSKGGKSIKETFAELDELGGSFSEEFIGQAKETDDQLKRLSFGWTRIKEVLAKQLLPVANKLIAWMTKAVKNLIALSKNTHVFESAAMFLKGALVALVVVLAAMNLELLPMYTMFAAIAAVVWGAYLVFDDLFALLNGGDSVIGDFLDKLGGKGTALQFVKDLRSAWDGISDALAKALGSSDGLWASMTTGIAKSIPAITGWGIKFVSIVGGAIDTVITGVRELIAVMSFAADSGAVGSDKWKKHLAEMTNLNDDWTKRQDAYKQLYGVGDQLTDVHASHGVSGSYGSDNASMPEQNSSQGNYQDRDKRAEMYERGQRRAEANRAFSDGAGQGAVASYAPIQLTQNITVQGSADKQTIAGVGKATKDGVKSAMNRNRDAYAAATAGAPAVTGGN